MKKFICLGMLALFLLTAGPAFALNPLYFYDWPGTGNLPAGYPSWLENTPEDKKSVSDAVKWELYTGYPDRTLKLTNNITRAEFAVALARSLDIGQEGGSTWYAGRRDALLQAGIITSATGNWDAPISRGEMGQWMGRAARQFSAGVKVSNVSYSDTTDPDIITAARAGVIAGYEDGTFRPGEKAQRVHAALMLVRLVRGLNSAKPAVDSLDEIAQKAFIEEQEARKDWVTGKTGQLDFSAAKSYESETNLNWLKLVEEEYQKSNPDYGWAKDVENYSAKGVELHRTAAIIKVSGKVQNYNKSGQAIYGALPYEGYNYFVKRDGKWLLTHSEPLN
ncbi:S-layer homology domain-containing protein [Desulfolucanica intricata]|uniref:S-layer homology domain-containing protein n=1 Tax=Desulfolucanica intricata TaxID=1285191 RepID=UPI0008358B61|nr:S-layer homology domain-containing protein [Desulfolucanica intricata]